MDSKGALDATGKENVERVFFWLFVAGLAWVPNLWGSNVLLAWGINAILFPGLAVAYELSVIVRGKPHPVSVKEIWVPAVLFALVVAWILVQVSTWTPASWQHPIWAMAAHALHRPVAGSISVNRDETTLALLRLITSASVFWVALQLCRNSNRAYKLLNAIAAIGCAYALYGFIALSLSSSSVTWFGHTAVRGFVTSTFYNRDNYATYAGIGLVAVCGLAFRYYRDQIAMAGQAFGRRIGAVIEATAQKGAILSGAGFVILAALFMTGSRGGILETVMGLAVLCLLRFGRRRPEQTIQTKAPIPAGLIVAAVILAVVIAVALFFGDAFFGKVAGQGFTDENRLAVYVITLRSIFASPLLGYGYGTFADVFPMFRDRSLPTFGVWQQAHDTYLEVFQGLGLIFGALLIGCVVLLVLRCAKGAVTRHQGALLCAVAASVAVLVGIDALADFSLQIQAVTLTFMAILGAGVAQAKSSRQVIHD